ncbi:MAG: glycosyltransferase [Proteobacteria bacterium]|nr:glycosyltransferase [Pseudomonadota bacterium]
MTATVFLSILIPVYNWDIGPLLSRLHDQCLHLSQGEEVEIIVMDDGSSEKYSNASVAEQLPLVRYQELGLNRGRAEIRNRLLDQAKGEYVLFVDADMLPDHDQFIQTYVEQGRAGAEIICGGISYLQNKEVHPDYSFYLYKSKKTEAVPPSVRNTIPWRYLFTSNIMVRRDILRAVSFDPQFTGYGFEDIEWGVRLGALFTIVHIDNSCSHMGVMKKKQVFVKMRDSIANYSLLLSLHPAKIGHTGAAGLARLLSYFPDALLRAGDRLLSRLFNSLAWNRFLFYIFQCDKAVLLARELKNESKGGLS